MKVAVAWFFEDESTAFTEGVLDLISAGDGAARSHSAASCLGRKR